MKPSDYVLTPRIEWIEVVTAVIDANNPYISRIGSSANLLGLDIMFDWTKFLAHIEPGSGSVEWESK